MLKEVSIIKLKVKDLDIITGTTHIAVMNQKDAHDLDVHLSDRLKLINSNKEIETVVLDITSSDRIVKPGQIGVCDEIMASLKLKQKAIIDVIPAKMPLSIEFIKKKLDCHNLSKDEIHQIIWDIAHDKLSNTEMSFFVSACYTNGMTLNETKWLTEAMTNVGEIFKIKRYPIIDKHCIGGVAANRTTPIVVAIIAAAGFTIPKTSSRAITSPAGTADTIEVLADVSFPIKKMKDIVMKTNACLVWGGSLNLAPADDKIIHVEKPLSIDSRSQLLASVMAKKASVSSTHLLIDIPWGKGSKIESLQKARQLKKQFEKIGRILGIKTKALLTDGSQPIGNGIGPSLEAIDVLKVLMQDKSRPMDLEKKSIMLASEILRLVKVKNPLKKAEELLKSGRAYKKLVEIIKAQGKKAITPDEINGSKFRKDVKASSSGVIKHVDNAKISKVARLAGAPVQKTAGVYLHRHTGDKIKKGDVVMTIHSESKFKLDYSYDICKKENPITIS